MKNMNIVIIIMDSVRIKNLSLFGYEKETDKNLKRIVREGILFKKHFSCSNFTFPSLISLLSGKYPNNHGLVHQFPYYTPEEFAKFKKNKFWFPSYLKQKGYSTIGIGWPGPWLKKGFDYYKEKETSEKKEKLKKILNKSFMKKILLSLPSWAYKLGKKIFKTRASVDFPYAHETINLAISKIKGIKKPFFLFIHFQDTHIPFKTTKNPKISKKNYEKILEGIRDKSQREYVKKRFTDIGLYSITDIKNKYDLAIKNVDGQIGRFVNFLQKERLWENTIFVVLSDHGLSLNENNIYLSSAGLYNETIRSPLIMKIPGIKGGIKGKEELVQNIDIVPTILEILGKEKQKDIDGVSMMPLIKEGKSVRNKILAFDGLAEDVKMIGTKKRKLIVAEKNLCYLCKSWHHKGRQEYDLEKDPNELKNIYSRKSSLEKNLKIKSIK